MLSHAIEEGDFDKLDAAAFAAEWKWDGIRIQASSGLDTDGRRVTKLYSRTGEEISGAFPDLLDAMSFDGALDGELLILLKPRPELQCAAAAPQPEGDSGALLTEFPAHIRAYDLLAEEGEDLRELPFAERRRGLRRGSRPAAIRSSISRL